MNSIENFILSLPKAELHIHIEGSFEPELMFKIAERNNIELKFKSVEEIRNAYKFNNLQEFLDIYYLGAQVLITEIDFYELTMEYLERAHKDNVIHAEIFFDPQTHTTRGVEFDTVINGIYKATQDAEQKFGISSLLIMSFLRHLTEDEAFETLEMAKSHREKIIGIGLDSSELGHPPEKFKRVFADAKNQGYKLVAHAGEEGPSDYITNSLDLLKIDRIDHGNRCLDDENLVDRITSEEIALTICPLSNLKLKVVETLEKHPLKTMLQKGLKPTVNSDDPAYFGGYINDNFLAVYHALELERKDLFLLAKNSIEASFMEEIRKDEILKNMLEKRKPTANCILCI
jgi:adenosine deaminase